MNLLEKVDSVEETEEESEEETEEETEEEEDLVIEENIEDQEVNLILDHLQGKFYLFNFVRFFMFLIFLIFIFFLLENIYKF